MTIDLFSQCDLEKRFYTSSFNICDDNPWVLIFEDNFDGNSLDLSKWNIVTGVPRDINFESQKAWHKPDNIVVENGLLKIISKRETLNNMPVVTSWNPYTVKYENFNYSSGEIWTKFNFEYGMFQARIKIPKGKGFWPAFWTFGGGPWNEIDIFEFWNENNIWNNYDPSKLSKVHHMNAWYDFDNDGNGNDCSEKYEGVDFSQDFHIFTMIWSRDHIYWYVDGDLKRTLYQHYDLEMSPVSCNIHEFDKYFYIKTFPKDPMGIILNVAIQCGTDRYGNNKEPDASTPFPSQMEVDWVKYYARKPCQDINITNSSQFPLSSDVYNVIVGEDVNINCSFSIQSGQQLEIIARDGITLGPGFSAELGSVFSAKIDPTICGSSLKSASLDSSINTEITEFNTSNNNLSSLINNIKVYPNPTNGSFTIDFGTNNLSVYQIKIIDTGGKIIYSNDKISGQTITIETNKFISGNYILYILNTDSKEAISHNLIIQ